MQNENDLALFFSFISNRKHKRPYAVHSLLKRMSLLVLIHYFYRYNHRSGIICVDTQYQNKTDNILFSIPGKSKLHLFL